MMEAAREYGWNLNYGGIALMWRGGCIIRSRFLGDIKKAFDNNPALENLLLDPFFKNAVQSAEESWRRVCATALLNGIPVPADHLGYVLLRRFPQRASTGKPVAGTTGLLWRSSV